MIEGVDPGRASSHVNPVVHRAIEIIDIGANSASRRRLELGRKRGDQQQDDGPGAGEAVQQADPEGLPPGADVAMGGAARGAVAHVSVAGGRPPGMLVSSHPEVPAHPLDHDPQRQEQDHDADRRLGPAPELPPGSSDGTGSGAPRCRPALRRVPCPTTPPELGGTAHVPLVHRHERGDRDKVVGTEAGRSPSRRAITRTNTNGAPANNASSHASTLHGLEQELEAHQLTPLDAARAHPDDREVGEADLVAEPLADLGAHAVELAGIGLVELATPIAGQVLARRDLAST